MVCKSSVPPQWRDSSYVGPTAMAREGQLRMFQLVHVVDFGRRLAAFTSIIGSMFILSYWILLLVRQMPDIARSDHLLAIWRMSAAIEAGSWVRVASWVFEFAGGHVIALARGLQIVNYLGFNYSGQFIKVAAIATFVATWLTLCCAALRSHGMGCIAGLTIVWGTWLLCSPVLVNLLVWPESVPPFLMSTAVVLLSATAVRTGSARGIGLSAIVMSITNGSGWLFLPAVLLARV